MPTYIALLRAVNVGGIVKPPMTELRAMGGRPRSHVYRQR